MANNNLSNCMKAISQLGLMDKVQITIGKNPKQATRLEFRGISKSVSALYKVDEFLDLLESGLKVNSVSSSKYNDCNEENEFLELQMWNDRQATYTKKCMYNYKTSKLDEILKWTCEDFGYTMKDLHELYSNWNKDPDTKKKASLKTNKDLIFKNGYYVAKASLRDTCKEWLSAHDLYECYKNNIDSIIYKWVKIGGC